MRCSGPCFGSHTIQFGVRGGDELFAGVPPACRRFVVALGASVPPTSPRRPQLRAHGAVVAAAGRPVPRPTTARRPACESRAAVVWCFRFTRVGGASSCTTCKPCEFVRESRFCNGHVEGKCGNVCSELEPQIRLSAKSCAAPSAWRSAEKQRRQWDTSRSHSDQPWPCASQLSQPSVRDPTRNFVAEPYVSSQHCMSNCICDSTCVFEEPRLCSCRHRHVDIHLHR